MEGKCLCIARIVRTHYPNLLTEGKGVKKGELRF